jgi:hypothetical protein
MRLILVILGLTSAVWAQTLGEYAGAAAGGAVGGASGKKVSEGITAVFQKVDQKTTAAAASTASKPDESKAPALIQANAGVPAAAAAKSKAAASKPEPEHSARVPRSRRDSVPPPPPLKQVAVVAPKPVNVPHTVFVPEPEVAPPPQATAEDLSKISVGWTREQVVALGFPAIRISMFDDGHLQELFQFMSNEKTVGVVRVTDGTVSAIQLR